jgi:aryl-alcohol dehydrogenase-like predicted oxidoreductase
MAMTKTVLPKVMFGTATLGNLYKETPWEEKKAVIEAIIKSAGDGVAVFDSAGKYGAGSVCTFSFSFHAQIVQSRTVLPTVNAVWS